MTASLQPTVTLFSDVLVLMMVYTGLFLMGILFPSVCFLQFCHKHSLLFFPTFSISFVVHFLFSGTLPWIFRPEVFLGRPVRFPFTAFPFCLYLLQIWWLGAANIFCHTQSWITFLKEFYHPFHGFHWQLCSWGHVSCQSARCSKLYKHSLLNADLFAYLDICRYLF